MSILLKEFNDVLQIAGNKEETCKSYVREVRLLEDFHGKRADEITEVE